MLRCSGKRIAADERRHVLHSPVEQEVESSESGEGQYHGDSVHEIVLVL